MEVIPAGWSCISVVVDSDTVVVTNIRFHLLEQVKGVLFRYGGYWRTMSANLKNVLVIGSKVIEVL